MAWPKRLSKKSSEKGYSRRTIPPPSQTPQPQHPQIVKTPAAPYQGSVQDPRSTTGDAYAFYQQRQASPSASSQDTTDRTSMWLAYASTRAEAVQDGRKDKGVERRAEEQKGHARQAGTDGQERSKIWERMAAKVGGHEGSTGSAVYNSEPLPRWLREV
ncbi:hypothetical protein F5Y12DRAFT_39462 [Xylaria sp. FL1777]|nr:hypothetical protein F5Y12DRAFT_39462 [Xylaria sp. FL1777]